MLPKEDFKVAFTIGVLHTRFSETFLQNEAQDIPPPKYMYTAVGRSLFKSCVSQEWRAFVVKLGEQENVRTPLPDLVVNLISEPIAQSAALHVLADLQANYQMPIVNPAKAIWASARHTLSDTLGGVDGIKVPRTTIFNLGALDIEDHVERQGHTWPLLLRPIGSHGGIGLIKIEKGGSLPEGPKGPFWYVTDFIDFRGKDGLYRKCRAVWTGQHVIRRHMIASDSWKIDGSSRSYMVEKTKLIEEERAFIKGGQNKLNDFIETLFRQTGLDFGVIDFALLEDGTVLIFELNATLQISNSIPQEKIVSWGYLENNNELILQSMVKAFRLKYESFQS